MRLATIAALALSAMLLTGCAQLDALRAGFANGASAEDAPPIGSSTAPDRRVLAAFPHVPDGYELAPPSETPAVDRAGNPSGATAFFLHSDDCCEAGDTYSYPPSVLIRKFPADWALLEYERSRIEELRSNPLFIEDSYRARTIVHDDVTWRRMEYRMALDEASDGEVPDLRALSFAAIQGGHLVEFATVIAAKDARLVDEPLLHMWKAADWAKVPAGSIE